VTDYALTKLPHTKLTHLYAFFEMYNWFRKLPCQFNRLRLSLNLKVLSPLKLQILTLSSLSYVLHVLQCGSTVLVVLLARLHKCFEVNSFFLSE